MTLREDRLAIGTLLFLLPNQVSPNFTLSSGEIAVGNPLADFERRTLTARNPGKFRLAPHALVRIDDASDEGTLLDDSLVYVWDAVFTEALKTGLAQHRDDCAADIKVMEKRHRQLERLAGTKIGCYRAIYVCDAAPPGRYQLQPSNVVRSSAWRLGMEATAGRLSIGAIVWKFSLGVLAAGFMCLLGLLFAIAAIGCTVQHFVDPSAVWDRDPVRGVIEPGMWACISVLATCAGIFLYRRKYFWAMAMIVPIGIIVTAVTSVYGF